MGNRLSKIYTRTGDNGTSALSDGSRLPKDDAVFVAMGDVDELNSHLGMILALLPTANLSQKIDKNTLCHELTVIQHLLFNLGGELAMPHFIGIESKHIHWLEQKIDRMNATLSPLKDFILPKGSLIVCQTHLARSVCRRAERATTTLKQQEPKRLGHDGLIFLNRLSDYLFVLGRYLTDDRHISETLWQKEILADL
ncbi:cob(I)yrinic acid a,c-diamide adenosyltransferase [Moraxella sp. VT-16-12]|uniref:cob(I)yrinic acid a,c-diamide adenosyltransferase n=1 Tax=Moraxella sp. VT-16-12 TaxID=2014877 RepID=UPI000B801E2C|nr:cob(I)yrinic acid a,c-diamide adenosyltransferase [Moraxella sp. VT-16-12]TWV84817.1 cob(I)yrinic acid a,c-diamide adenosyltransferase [Moraxella sp. VT-16-12]